MFIFFVLSTYDLSVFFYTFILVCIQKSNTFVVSLLEPEETRHRKQVGSNVGWRRLESPARHRNIGQFVASQQLLAPYTFSVSKRNNINSCYGKYDLLTIIL